jgi:hypothetical protein
VEDSIPRQCARLAREIRRNSDKRVIYNYPERMELATTCCCHIVIDDPNFEDHNVAFCIQTAAKNEHPECLRLALLLARASFTQRRKANYLAWSWLPDGMEEWR